MKPPHQDAAGCLRWISTHLMIGSVVLSLLVVVDLAANDRFHSIPLKSFTGRPKNNWAPMRGHS